MRARLVLVAAAAALLLPIWWPPVPAGEGLAKLGALAAWARIGDPAWGVARFYATRALGPGALYFWIARALAVVLPVGAASKVALSLYALAVPAGLAALAKRMGRDPLLALLGAPLAVGWCLQGGAYGFCFATAALVGGLALLDRFLDAPDAKRLAAAAGAALALVLAHGWVALLGAVCAAALAATRLRDRRRAAVGALAAALALAAAAIALAPPLPAREPLLRGFIALPARLLAGWPGSDDDLLLLLLAASWITIASTARGPAPRARARLPEIGFTAAAIASLAIPQMLLPAALFGALLPRGPLAGRRLWLLAPALVAALAWPPLLAAHLAAFGRHAAAPLALLAKVPRGVSTRVLLDATDDDALDAALAPYGGMHGAPLLVAGGFDPDRADAPPLRALPGARLPDDHYVLVRGERVPAGARPLARDGAWHLYRVGGAF